VALEEGLPAAQRLEELRDTREPVAAVPGPQGDDGGVDRLRPMEDPQGS